jgi:hypothetical protein
LRGIAAEPVDIAGVRQLTNRGAFAAVEAENAAVPVN